jgi:uncharacterized linocin/CFP29 family protein
MDDLRRPLAPITAAAWEAIEAEARRTLQTTLAARKLVDFTGPLGWSTSAANLGRTAPLPERNDGIAAALRRVQPLVELRAEFELAREEVDAIARGAPDPNLDPVRTAAQKMAKAEDRAVLVGYPEAGIVGIQNAAAERALTISENYEQYPGVVAAALAKLRQEGVDGPYAIALGPRCYPGLMRTTTPSGYPIIEHVRRLLAGPVIWAPAIDGALVVSLRGGDFDLVVGRDLSIGYEDHSSTAVRLYLQESFTFRVLSREAAVLLNYA